MIANKPTQIDIYVSTWIGQKGRRMFQVLILMNHSSFLLIPFFFLSEVYIYLSLSYRITRHRICIH